MTTYEPWPTEALPAHDPAAAEACRRLNEALPTPGPFDPGEEAGRPHGRVWLARAAGEAGPSPAPVRGYLVAWRVADELEILFVATDPAFRRRGVGRALLRRAAEAARAEGLARVLLEVAGRNDAARALYRGFGFRELGVRRGYYADGDDAVMMGFELGA
ncbi:MAG TPA: GNAT family N-acetyltransferase [Polyangiaceae bacterium]|nr:GNAT family N-acetyltransferase [Polyangiaceae bacterium]